MVRGTAPRLRAASAPLLVFGHRLWRSARSRCSRTRGLGCACTWHYAGACRYRTNVLLLLRVSFVRIAVAQMAMEWRRTLRALGGVARDPIDRPGQRRCVHRAERGDTVVCYDT